MNMSDLGQSGRGLRDLLSLLNDLLGVLFDSGLFLLNDLGEFLDLLLKRLLIFSLLDGLSSLNFFVDFLRGLRSDGNFSVLGLLLHLLVFDFKSLDGLLHGDDLGVDSNIFLLILLELGGFSLDVGLVGFDLSLKVGDFIIDLGLVLLLLGGGLLVLELSDFLRVLGHSGLVLLDVSLLLNNSVSDQSLLSVILSSLCLNSLLSLVGGMLVSDGILSNGDSLVSVLVSVVSSANSVNASSLDLLVLLEGVVRSSLDGSVGSVVGLPGGSDCGQSLSVGADSRGNFSDVLLVLLDLTLD
jgi:hypothetical protein